MSCDFSLSEHADYPFLRVSEPGELVRCDDPKHRAALARRAAGAEPWSAIVRAADAGGTRDYLELQAIHCGSGLELQAIEYHSDDYGEYSLPLSTGVRVRYELAWAQHSHDPERAIVLHGEIAGHEFTARHETSMRFRWPRKT